MEKTVIEQVVTGQAAGRLLQILRDAGLHPEDGIRIENDEQASVRAPVAEQAVRLRDLHARLMQRHSLEPGQPVRFKDGFGSFKDELRPTHAFVLWRWLDFEDEQDRAIILAWNKPLNAASRVDCLLGYICNDGHCVIEMPALSWELEPASYD